MNNNELASLIGTIIGILPDLTPSREREQLYRAASKAIANAGFGTIFMADTQNELTKAFMDKIREKEKECGCPACQFEKSLRNKGRISFDEVIEEIEIVIKAQRNRDNDFGQFAKDNVQTERNRDTKHAKKYPRTEEECHPTYEAPPPPAQEKDAEERNEANSAKTVDNSSI